MSTSTSEKSLFSSNKLRQAAHTLYAAGKDFIQSNGVQWAAAIAYYSLLSIFPLLLATVSIAAFFVSPDWVINQITNLLGQFLPQGETRIEEIIQGAFEARGTVSIFSLLLLLWSGTRVFGVLAKALNMAFESSDPYGFFKRLLVELIMVLTLGLLFVLAMISRMAIQFLWNRVDIFPGEQGILFAILQELIPALLMFVVFALIYRYVPTRDVDTKAALAGALFATLMIMIARPLFLGYLTSFADYNLIYGSLAIVVILIIWTWIMALIILLGGQLTAEIQLDYFDGGKRKREESR